VLGTHQVLGGGSGGRPVPGEEDGSAQQDAAVGIEPHADSVQRFAVVDATAAGFAHAVGGDDAAAGGAGGVQQFLLRGGAAHQDGAEAGQVCSGRQQSAQLGGHQRHVRAVAGGGAQRRSGLER